MTRLLESEKEGVFANAVILTADDGTTAIETLQQQTSAGRQVHFVLMDSIMVAACTYPPYIRWNLIDHFLSMNIYRRQNLTVLRLLGL